MSPTGTEQKSCIEAVSAERNNQGRTGQATPDELSAYERRSSDSHLVRLVLVDDSFGCIRPHYKFVVYSELNKVAKAEELLLAIAKLLHKGVDGDIVFNHSKLFEVSRL